MEEPLESTAEEVEEIDVNAARTMKSPAKGCVSWLQAVTTRVYVAHAITTWGDRMWAFAISLFLVKLSSDSSKLRMPAIFGFTSCCLLAISGAAVGRWVDRTSRMKAAVRSMVSQNSLVVVSAVVLCIAMHLLDELQVEENYWIVISIQASVIVLGSAAYLASLASNISISKDWVKVIALKDSNCLADINATCKRIDLVTKLCAPILVGNIMALVSYLGAAIFIASWNIVSMVIEYLLLRSIYKQVPELAVKMDKGIPMDPEVLEPLAESPAVKLQGSGACIRGQKSISNFIDPWRIYSNHHIFPAGFALACLYMTVLALDGILIGFAYSQGLSEYILGALGGIGALVGICGTVVFPVLRKHIGIERTGLLGFFLQVTCLALCVVSVFAPGSPFDPGYLPRAEETHWKDANHSETTYNEMNSTEHNSTMELNGPSQRNYTSVILLIVGVVTSRGGLWIVDLTINQILQEEVADREIGAINGVQHSLNMMLSLVCFTLVILLPSPETFGYLIMASYAFILMGWTSYAIYSKRKRHHILPFHGFFQRFAATNSVPNLQVDKIGTKP